MPCVHLHHFCLDFAGPSIDVIANVMFELYGFKLCDACEQKTAWEKEGRTLKCLEVT